jgi:ribA/ribD-fused uncharacterized protein
VTDDCIKPFSGRFAFLSNLYPAPVEWRGRLFPTVENAFQAAKTDDVEAWDRLTELPPDVAVAFGQGMALRQDWEVVKQSVMAELLAAKFEIPALRRALLATAPAELVNEAWWGDTYWGVTRGRGDNHLGRLLMAVRASLAG